MSNSSFQRKDQFYAVRRCASLDGPAVFLHWNDFERFVSQSGEHERGRVEFKRFEANEMLDALNYICNFDVENRSGSDDIPKPNGKKRSIPSPSSRDVHGTMDFTRSCHGPMNKRRVVPVDGEIDRELASILSNHFQVRKPSRVVRNSPRNENCGNRMQLNVNDVEDDEYVDIDVTTVTSSESSLAVTPSHALSSSHIMKTDPHESLSEEVVFNKNISECAQSDSNDISEADNHQFIRQNHKQQEQSAGNMKMDDKKIEVSIKDSHSRWSKEDDMQLIDILKNHKRPLKDWDLIAKEHGRDKSAEECFERWTRYLKSGSRKGNWQEHEDAAIAAAVADSLEQPFSKWTALAEKLPGRNGKQIRDRWVNYLNPAINHMPFTNDEDLVLLRGYEVLGRRWKDISEKYFDSCRGENQVKNRWHSASWRRKFGHLCNQEFPGKATESVSGSADNSTVPVQH